MAIPEFITALRTKIGHDLLLLPSVTAIVLDDTNRLLMVRRLDNNQWTLVGGVIEPGEQPADALIREVAEETTVDVEPTHVLGIRTSPPAICPNGDHVQWVETVFVCRYISGTACVGDDESVDVGWFDTDALPEPLDPWHHQQLHDALAGRSSARFVHHTRTAHAPPIEA